MGIELINGEYVNISNYSPLSGSSCIKLHFTKNVVFHYGFLQ